MYTHICICTYPNSFFSCSIRKSCSSPIHHYKRYFTATPNYIKRAGVPTNFKKPTKYKHKNEVRATSVFLTIFCWFVRTQHPVQYAYITLYLRNVCMVLTRSISFYFVLFAKFNRKSLVALYFLLQLEESIEKRFSSGRTAWNVDVYWNDAVAASHNRV